MPITAEKGNISVHTDNLFPIIKKWLYSEHDIFLRELISNSHDAINKLQRLADLGQFKGAVPKPLIKITIDKKKKTLAIEDNGLGMTSEEVKKYINQIAFSGAKDFLEKYKEGKEDSQIIGHFGMGFFSSFMVADLVDLNTLSYIEGSDAVHWSCDGSTSFSMDASKRKEMGTEIVLHINKDNEDFLDEQKIKDLVKRFSNYIPMEIKVNDQTANAQKALWNQAPAKLKEEDYKKFHSEIFPMEGEPLFHVHFSVDYPFHLKGIIYFPRNKNDFEVNKKGRVQLYCNNVFVSDNVIDIIPPYLNLLNGVLDSPDIPLNVSRSFLQNDPQVKKIGNHIVSKIADKLTELFKKERETFEKYWEDIHPFVKFACLSDEKFYDKVKDALLFKTLDDKFITLKEYQEQNSSLKDKVIYTSDKEKQIAYIEKVKAMGVSAVVLDSPIDTHFMQHIEMKSSPVKFLRVDSDIGEQLTGENDDKKDADKKDDKKFEKLTNAFKSSVNKDQLDIKVQKFKDKDFCAMITQSEQMRRMTDMTAMMSGQMPGGAKFDFNTLVLNESNNIIEKIKKLSDSWDEKDKSVEKESNKELAWLCQSVYDLALLQSDHLKGEQLTQFVKRTTSMLEDKLGENAKPAK